MVATACEFQCRACNYNLFESDAFVVQCMSFGGGVAKDRDLEPDGLAHDTSVAQQ